MFKGSKITKINVHSDSLLLSKRAVYFVSEHSIKPVAGAAVDAAIRTPISATLDLPVGMGAKSATILAAGANESILKQFQANSLLVLPIIGRFRGAIMRTLRRGLDSNQSPIFHPIQTAANFADNINNSIQRVLGGVVHGDSGPAVQTTKDMHEAIAQAKATYECSKQDDPIDNEISLDRVPFIGAPHAIFGGAKEFFLDTTLQLAYDTVVGAGGKTLHLGIDTLKKMFIKQEGEDLNILKRLAKIPTGLLSGISDLFLSKEKSPIWHLIRHTLPDTAQNATLSIARAGVGTLMGDPGNQVTVGEGTAKARGFFGKVFTNANILLGRAGNFLKGAGGGAAAEAGAPAAAAAAAAA